MAKAHHKATLGAGLDYGEEVHRLVKNFHPNTILFMGDASPLDLCIHVQEPPI